MASNKTTTVLALLKKHSLLAGLLIVIGSGLAFAMSDKPETYSWRYKMTIEVNTPEGIKTGSSVREVTQIFIPTHNRDSRDPKYNNAIKLKGEAVVIDLGKRGKVFALLKGPQFGVDYGSSLPFYAFPGPAGGTIEGAKYYSELKARKVLDINYYPMLVTFTDLNDPKTIVSLVEFKSNNKIPAQHTIQKENFSKYFGEGVHLKTVALEMAKEEVSWGIEKHLPWLPTRKNIRGYLGSSSEPPHEDPTKTYLNGNEFSTGRFW